MNVRNEWSEADLNLADLFYTKEETINSVKENFDIRRYYSSEGYSVTVDGKTEQVIIQNHSNPINESDVDKKILLSMDADVHTGSYVLFRDKFWMINSNVDIVDDAYKLCQMQLCTFILKFQSRITGEILSYPCITTNRIQGTGDKETDVMTLPDGRKKVILPCDKNTILLTNGDRFYLDKHPTKPRVYQIDFVDTTVGNYGEKGLIELYLSEDQSGGHNDRPDLGVCDYFKPTVPIKPIEGGYVLIDVNKLMLGVTTTITPIFYDEDDVVQNNVIAVWSIDKPNGVTASYINNRCSITIPDDDMLLGENVTIQISDVDGNYSSTFELVIETGW